MIIIKSNKRLTNYTADTQKYLTKSVFAVALSKNFL